jgi:hypothetical protein
MNLRTMKRSKAKANGNPLRYGPAKGTTGKEKGPARSPSLAETRRAVNAEAKRAKAAAETKAAEKVAA